MSATINILNSDLQKAFDDIAKYGKEVQRKVKTEIRRTSYAVTNKAQRNLKDNKSWKTGRLVSSMPGYAAKHQDLSRLQARAGTDVEYGGYVEYGTPPHIITVKKAKVLAKYLNTSGGKANFQIFGKTVKHPGSRPKPFLFPAAESERKKYEDNITKILNDSTGTK